MVLLAAWASTAHAGALVFIDDYEGFLAAAGGSVETIDFWTLPDGSPSYAGAEITPEFNYTNQGVTFSSPHPRLYLAGNDVVGYILAADSYPDPDRNWIIADVVEPGRAVGTYFVSSCFLSAFDADGSLIADVAIGSGGTHFLGIVSDSEIDYAVLDRHTTFAGSDQFVFAPVPEASTAALLALGFILCTSPRGARRSDTRR